jgi:dCMP deaminase
MPKKGVQRPEHKDYFMGIAMAVRARANCVGNRVGAILVTGNRIISTGYNGTPENMTNCLDGGCYRCANRDKYPKGTSYDLCICVHAEQNALLAAARFGIPTQGATLYSTMRPCFGCTKELLQAKIERVYFCHDWSPDAAVRHELEKLQAGFRYGIHGLKVTDKDIEWAVSTKRQPPPSTGHTTVGV